MIRRALGFFLILMLLTGTTVSADVTIDTQTNATRAAAGLTILATSATLETIAQQRAREAASNFAHDPWIYSAMGCYKWAGENLAWGTVNTNFVEEWLRSPSHKANMLYPDFDQQGSAIYVDPNTGIVYAAQIFKDSCDSTGAIIPSTDRTGSATNEGSSSGVTGTELQTPVPLLPDTSTTYRVED
jgi:hypothetical protein